MAVNQTVGVVIIKSDKKNRGKWKIRVNRSNREGDSWNERLLYEQGRRY